MQATPAWNRALQLRAIDAIRGRLQRSNPSGLPSVENLAQTDHAELCEIGAGRLGAVAVVRADPTGAGAPSDFSALIDLVEGNVRRTDLLLMLDPCALVLFAPGLDPRGGQCLIDRLTQLLADHLAEGHVGAATLGAAYRSPLSMPDWDVVRLAQEARRRALSRLPEAEPALERPASR